MPYFIYVSMQGNSNEVIAHLDDTLGCILAGHLVVGLTAKHYFREYEG